MEEQNYVVMCNEIDLGRQERPWENIQGTGPTDAVRRRFGKHMLRATGEMAYRTDVIVVRGHYNEQQHLVEIEGKTVYYNFIEA